MKKIKISELRIIFHRILDKLEFEVGKNGELDLPTEVYRKIPSSKWNRFEKPEDWFSASEITQGDLSDDLDELLKLVNDKDRVCTYVDFDRLSSILKEISQDRNPI